MQPDLHPPRVAFPRGLDLTVLVPNTIVSFQNVFCASCSLSPSEAAQRGELSSCASQMSHQANGHWDWHFSLLQGRFFLSLLRTTQGRKVSRWKSSSVAGALAPCGKLRFNPQYPSVSPTLLSTSPATPHCHCPCTPHLTFLKLKDKTSTVHKNERKDFRSSHVTGFEKTHYLQIRFFNEMDVTFVIL